MSRSGIYFTDVCIGDGGSRNLFSRNFRITLCMYVFEGTTLRRIGRVNTNTLQDHSV